MMTGGRCRDLFGEAIAFSSETIVFVSRNQGFHSKGLSPTKKGNGLFLKNQSFCSGNQGLLSKDLSPTKKGKGLCSKNQGFCSGNQGFHSKTLCLMKKGKGLYSKNHSLWSRNQCLCLEVACLPGGASLIEAILMLFRRPSTALFRAASGSSCLPPESASGPVGNA